MLAELQISVLSSTRICPFQFRAAADCKKEHYAQKNRLSACVSLICGRSLAFIYSPFSSWIHKLIHLSGYIHANKSLRRRKIGRAAPLLSCCSHSASATTVLWWRCVFFISKCHTAASGFVSRLKNGLLLFQVRRFCLYECLEHWPGW